MSEVLEVLLYTMKKHYFSFFRLQATQLEREHQITPKCLPIPFSDFWVKYFWFREKKITPFCFYFKLFFWILPLYPSILSLMLQVTVREVYVRRYSFEMMNLWGASHHKSTSIRAYLTHISISSKIPWRSTLNLELNLVQNMLNNWFFPPSFHLRAFFIVLHLLGMKLWRKILISITIEAYFLYVSSSLLTTIWCWKSRKSIKEISVYDI